MLKDKFDDIQHIGIPTKDLKATEKFWLALGFTKVGEFDTDVQSNGVIFMQKAHLMIESWLDGGNQATGIAGAINHISLNTTEIQEAFNFAKQENFDLIDSEVQSLDFWDKGIKYFNIKGPNGEIVEFCERLK